ncbi:uncharacterized protein RB166_013944 isoform 1-T1 [Leptodactylus fuscus]
MEAGRGKCPTYDLKARCLSRALIPCHSKEDCKWDEMCCDIGCGKTCLKVSTGFPVHPKHPPEKPDLDPFIPPFKPFIPTIKPIIPPVKPFIPPFKPITPPAKPYFPYPYNPYKDYSPPDPLPDFRPQYPPMWFPPFDPNNFGPDDYLPVFPGNDNFP